MDQFRWGIIGSGYVARKFALGLPSAENAVAAAVTSRTPANAEAFAKRYGVRRSFRSVEELVACSEIDAIYVATPPREHAAHALACIEAGKPVLVEKPFALDARDARIIADAAAKNDVFCMEGLWTRFLPAVLATRDLVRSGDLGEIRSARGSFFAPPVSEARGLFDKASGGGALLQRGVYPVSLACFLLGEAAKVAASARIGEGGVDEEVVLTLTHQSGAISVSQASLRTGGTSEFVIHGTKGVARLHAPIYRPFSLTVERVAPRIIEGGRGSRFETLKESALMQGLQQRFGGIRSRLTGGGKTTSHRFTGNGYHYEADEVARCVRAGLKQSEIMPLSESISIMSVLDQARQVW